MDWIIERKQKIRCVTVDDKNTVLILKTFALVLVLIAWETCKENGHTLNLTII